MHIVKKGDTGVVSKVVNGLKVTVNHLTIHDNLKEGERYQHTTELDWTGVPSDVILGLASDTIIIKARGLLGLKKVDPAAIPTTIVVAELLKKAKDKAKASNKAVLRVARARGLTDEGFEQAIADYKAKLVAEAQAREDAKAK